MNEKEIYEACVAYMKAHDKRTGQYEDRKDMTKRFILLTLYDGEGSAGIGTATIDPSIKLPCNPLQMSPGQAAIMTAGEEMPNIILNKYKFFMAVKEATETLGFDLVGHIKSAKNAGLKRKDVVADLLKRVSGKNPPTIN